MVNRFIGKTLEKVAMEVTKEHVKLKSPAPFLFRAAEALQISHMRR